MKRFTPTALKTAYTLSNIVLLTFSVNSWQSAKAQVNSAPIIDSDGSFQIDQNAFDIRSGPLENASDIPLPQGPVANPEEGHAQPVFSDRLAPNSIHIQADTEYIDRQLQSELLEQLQPQINPNLSPQDFGLQPESLHLRTQFDVRHSAGNHAYGEGIEVNVYSPDGTLRETQRVFVSGDRVRYSPEGLPLPQADSIAVTYGAQDRVELRVLNLRPEAGGGVSEHESAVYPNINGTLAVEDLQNGGDLDFNDGDYLEIHNGVGETHLTGKLHVAVADITVTTDVIETPLPPLERQATTRVESLEATSHQFTTVEETREYGDVEVPTTDTNLLPHARGLTTPDGEQLIYNQYAATSQVRLGTDAGVVSGQFAPLTENPAAAPTLLIGTARLNPFADDNQAGITASVGVAQYLNSTHEDAIDMYGNRIPNPDPEGPRLVQPTGMFHDTHLVGYVPVTPDEVIPGISLTSNQGIFELPADQAIVIAPPDPQRVGRGDAAYTGNVGGLIIERTDGTAELIPQWTPEGFATTAIALPAGQADRVIYALVPQQTGQHLTLGQTYALNSVAEAATAGYFITDGGFRVISALQQPQNFVRETAEVYAVEDTLPGPNAVTPNFNGIPGLYREQVGGELIATVDLTNPITADARVGNLLTTEPEVIPGNPGQLGYYATNVAGGLYVRGSLSLGLGNQEDVITTTTSTYDAQVTNLITTTTTNVFQTPTTQVDSFTTTTTATTFRDVQQEGDASFGIGADGRLANVTVNLSPAEVSERVVTETLREFDGSATVLGSEFLADSRVDINSVTVQENATLIDRQVDTETDTYPNVTPLLGEIALGGLLNFGNTPWTPAANTLRTEIFARGTLIGESHDDEAVGLRAEIVFHPFGEIQRPAYGYDASGQIVTLFQTEPLLDSQQAPVVEQVETVNGDFIEVPVNQFVYDDNGDLVPATVGTGRTSGPGIFLNLEELLTDDEGPTVAGGLQFTF